MTSQPAQVPADPLATALAEALACLYALTRLGDPTPIGWQTANPIRPATYDRWQAALQTATVQEPCSCTAAATVARLEAAIARVLALADEYGEPVAYVAFPRVIAALDLDQPVETAHAMPDGRRWPLEKVGE